MNPKQFHRRLIGVVLVLAILMTFLCSNLYSIQYVNGEDYANQSVARSYETQTVPASRGPILDRNGKVGGLGGHPAHHHHGALLLYHRGPLLFGEHR